MKKILALIMAIAMVLSLAACGDQQTTDIDTADASVSASASVSAPAETAETSAEGSAIAAPEALSYADYEDSANFNAGANAAVYEGTDEWSETVWNFACSIGDTSTWAQAGYYFNALMQESTGGKVQVNVYADEQLSNGSQVDGIQMLMDGDNLQVSLHSNLTYANFDPRFNVVSLPYLFADYEAADAAMAGEGGAVLSEVLSEYGLHCAGIAENGFHQITNAKRPVKSVADLSSIKMCICPNDLCAEIYNEWGCDATVMNWDETYTALEQKTADGEENPETVIASASVQDVQSYISLWNAYYDCLFLCINQNAYDQFTEAQKAVIDANAAEAVAYQKHINRANVEKLVAEWTQSGAMDVTPSENMDSDSFKNACTGAEVWFVNQLVGEGMTQEEAQAFVDAFKA